MSQPNDNLKKVLATMFESWAMMFPDEEPYPEIAGGGERGDKHHVSVFFEGVAVGRVDLWLSDDLARSLAVNVMGLMDLDEVDGGLIEDALRELGNLMCGHFLTMNYGNQHVFNVGLPMVDKKDLSPAEYAEKVRLLVEGQEIVGDVSFVNGF